jgi:peptide/nickel transport system substrate-binding protein
VYIVLATLKNIYFSFKENGMKKFSSLLALSLMIVLLGALLVPVSAQDDEVPGPGEGGPIVYPNLGNDIATLNPIINADGSSNRVIARIFPTFIGVDPDTISFAPGANGSLATAWETSEDGLTFTVSLRDDWSWSDGTPITAADIVYGFDAIEALSETNDTPLSYVLASAVDAVAVDDYTVAFTLPNPSCTAIFDIAAIPVVPSHIYSEVFPEFADMVESDFNLSDPGATAATWSFANFRPGEQVTLLADQNYPDSELGYVVPQGWVYRNVADQTLIVEQFIEGDLTYLQSAPSDRKDEIRELGAAGEIQVYEAPAGTVRFISLNTADPSNPQPAFDDDGNAIDQGFHPILGDLRVRQALMHAMDWEGLNIAVFNSEGIQLASHWLPTNWAYDPEAVPFYEFDLDLANSMLEEAGWVMGDDGVRVAQGAPYAEDGTPLAFELITNAGNTENESLMLLLVDMWAEVGVELDAQAVDFNLLVDTLLAQTYDAVMVFWGFGTPAEPNSDMRATFSPENDLPGGGFNTTSTNIPRLNEILEIANDPAQTNGCDQDIQRDLYLEAYGILRDDVSWIWISTSIVVSAAQGYVQNFDPRPGSTFWNEDAWAFEPEAR